MTLQQTEAFDELILGLDIGTSGIRGSIVSVRVEKERNSSNSHRELWSDKVELPFPEKNDLNRQSVQDAELWSEALASLFDKMSASPYWKNIRHIVADATSSTVLLCDVQGKPLTRAMMYDDQQARNEAELVSEAVNRAGVETGALGASSTLAKVIFLMRSTQCKSVRSSDVLICHQIDFINCWLTGQSGITDENNALKLGYDSINRCWPAWVENLIVQTAQENAISVKLPKVICPGEFLAKIQPDLAKRYGLSDETQIYAGTTDSIAGFLASGASEIGDGVTSLGSTIALKLISDKPIFNAEYGIYSHRLGDSWLVGGASNAGGAVLLEFFPLEEIKQLILALQKLHLPNDQDFYTDRYYPLLRPGERFPIADGQKQPQLPGPAVNENSTLNEKARFLFGLLQGLCYIEELGYNRLHQMGASRLRRIYSVGGGTQNAIWQHLRQLFLPVDHQKPISLDASFGVTRLLKNIKNHE